MRLNERLDLIIMNETDAFLCTTILPLESESGCASDHQILDCRLEIGHCHKFEWISYRTCDMREKNFDKFGSLYCAIDWEDAIGGTDCPSTMTTKLHRIITELTNKCFTWQNRRIRSTDDPWIMDEIRRTVRRRMRKFRKYQRSRKWQVVKEETDLLIKEAKADYYQKAMDKLNAEGGNLIPYKILKNIAIPDRPKTWTINSLNP